MMFRSLLAALAIAAIVPQAEAQSAPAKADRVQQCVADNASEKQTATVISSYCGCMADKIPASSAASVTEWEASNTAVRDTCATGAKWVVQ